MCMDKLLIMVMNVLILNWLLEYSKLILRNGIDFCFIKNRINSSFRVDSVSKIDSI